MATRTTRIAGGNRKVAGTKTTTNATPAALTFGGGGLLIPSDTTAGFEITVVARRTDADGESAMYVLRGCLDRNGAASTTALVGSVTKEVTAEDTAAWDVAATADTTNGGLTVTVTGEAAKTISWKASARWVEVTG